MANDVQIPNEFQSTLVERKDLYRKKKEAEANNETLIGFNSTFKDSGNVNTEKKQSSDGTPPAEVAAVLPQLKSEADAVKNANQSIRSYQSELNQIQSGCLYKVMKMIGMATLVGFSIVWIVLQ